MESKKRKQKKLSMLFEVAYQVSDLFSFSKDIEFYRWKTGEKKKRETKDPQLLNIS